MLREPWRPIEVAPKDGTPFLGAIYWSDSREWKILPMKWQDSVGLFVDATYAPFAEDQEQPLCWLPLPEPPAT